MILCNLAVLLGQRKMKISKLAADTGISRTTLTALYYNTGRGVQFDTANVLCMYLNIGMGELFTTLLFDLTVESCHFINQQNTVYVILDCKVQYKDRVEYPTLSGIMKPFLDEKGVLVGIDATFFDSQPENNDSETILLNKVFHGLRKNEDWFIKDAKLLIESRLRCAIQDEIEKDGVPWYSKMPSYDDADYNDGSSPAFYEYVSGYVEFGSHFSFPKEFKTGGVNPWQQS